jgi:hypothetical protein
VVVRKQAAQVRLDKTAARVTLAHTLPLKVMRVAAEQAFIQAVVAVVLVQLAIQQAQLKVEMVA